MCAESQILELSAIMLLVYGDESLDETRSRVCAVAGLFGNEHDWISLEDKWKDLNGSVPFHASHCDSDQVDYEPTIGEDADERHRKNKFLYRSATTLLAESGIAGFAAAYHLTAQREVFNHAPPVYYQPFIDVLQVIRNCAEDNGDVAELTFDSRIESEHNAGLVYANLRESNPAWKDHLAEKISFLSSRKNPRIQAADLFAHEAMKALDNELGPKKRPIRGSWKCLRDTGRFLVCSFSYDYFRAAKADMENLKSIFGFIPEDFTAWLKARNRQNNLTAYFEFLNWHVRNLSPEKRNEINEKLNRWRPI